MKDILLKSSRIKKELIIWMVCLVAAIALNIYSILKYKTDWSELLGQLHVVIAIAFIIYFVVLVLRLLVFGITRLMQKK